PVPYPGSQTAAPSRPAAPAIENEAPASATALSTRELVLPLPFSPYMSSGNMPGWGLLVWGGPPRPSMPSKARLAFSLPSQLHNLAAPGKQHHARHPDKQSMLHHTRHLTQLNRQPIRVRNLPKAAIQNVIPLVGYIRRPVAIHSHRHLRPQSRNALRHQRLRKLDDLHRQRKLPRAVTLYVALGTTWHPA